MWKNLRRKVKYWKKWIKQQILSKKLPSSKKWIKQQILSKNMSNSSCLHFCIILISWSYMRHIV